MMGCCYEHNLLGLYGSQNISAGCLSQGICIDSSEINRYSGKVCWGEEVPGPTEISWCFGFADTGISRMESLSCSFWEMVLLRECCSSLIRSVDVSAENTLFCRRENP